MERDEDIKQRINQLIHVQDNLCPELFAKNQKLRPEVKEVILNIVDLAGELISETFIDVKLKDVLLCGSCAGFLYLPQSEIDLVLLWEMPEELQSPEEFEEKLKLGNSGYRHRGFNFQIYGRNVNYVSYATMPGGSGIYSVMQNKWLSFPERKHFTYSLNDLYDRFVELDEYVNQFMSSLPKSKEGFISPSDCLKAENFYQMLYIDALDNERKSPEKEYNIDFQAFRIFRKLGKAAQLKKYVRDSYFMYFA